MSSIDTKTKIEAFFASDIPGEANVIDLTAEYQTIKDFLTANSITSRDAWVGLQYPGATELPIALKANNTQGKYREEGTVLIHIVEPQKSTAYSNLKTRAQAIQNAFRGQRINDIIIESAFPPNFENGATLQFEGGFTACSILIEYYKDISL